MKYIIFSDAHSNLEAIDTFSRIAESVTHDKRVCLGDIVGYNADPNPCVEWVRETVDIALAGNHDYAVLGKTDTTYFNSSAYQACMWTRRELTEKNKRFLGSLPVEKEEDGVYWVHSSPFEPMGWHYVSNVRDAEVNFEHFQGFLCFLGHSHLPGVIEQRSDNKISCYVVPQVDLEPCSRYIINVGSLGQPRDGNPDPTFVLYDSEKQSVEFRRFSYDLGSTQKKIMACGLPAYLADRLELGR